jgi:hypothetical protein
MQRNRGEEGSFGVLLTQSQNCLTIGRRVDEPKIHHHYRLIDDRIALSVGTRR